MRKALLILLILLLIISSASALCQPSGDTRFTPQDVTVSFYFDRPIKEVCFEHSIPEGGKKIFNGPTTVAYVIFFEDNTIRVVSVPKELTVIDNILGVLGI